MNTNYKKPLILSVFLIIALGFAVYGNTLNNAFIWDDEFHIEKNDYIKTISYFPQIFSSDLGKASNKEYGFYRPLQTISYMVDYFLWDLNPTGYHLTNLLLHILVAIGLYWFINALFKDNLLSFLTGCLYVVHPIHTEAVSYISGRADSLALLFMLLSFILYLRNGALKNIGLYFLMCLCYTLALLSKESSLILPVLVLVYHYSFRRKINAKAFFALTVLAAFYILLRFTLLETLLLDNVQTTTLMQRLPGFFMAITNYIQLLILPFDLHMEYLETLFSWGNPRVILGVISTLTLLIFAVRRRSDPLMGFSIIWFFVALLPVSNFYSINAYMAEHWMYVPSIGFFLLAARVISSLVHFKNLKVITIIMTVSLISFYSYLTVRQNTYWREPVSFYKRTIKYSPDGMRMHFNLGRLYTKMGMLDDAISSYKKAIEVKPDYAMAYGNLAVIYADMGQQKQAVELMKRAIEVKPDYAVGYYNLGNVYSTMNKKAEAMVAYKNAIKINANYAGAFNDLGNIYFDTGQISEAIASYKKAIAIRAGYADAYHNLGIAYNEIKKYDDAIEAYQKAIAIKADFAEAHNHLGVALSALNKNEEALVSCQNSIDINPQYALAYNNLAVIYLHMKQYKLAIKNYDRAQELGYTNAGLQAALEVHRKQ